MSVALDISRRYGRPSYQPYQPVGQTVLTDSERAAFCGFAQSDKTVAILVRRRKAFLRSLTGLREKLHSSVALVAFIPQNTVVKPEVGETFDLLIYYDDSKNVFDGVTSTNQIQLPLLHKFVNELLCLMPREKILLMHTEEATIREVCRVKERFGLKGVYMKDIEHLLEKELIAEIAQQSDIPTAKTVFVDFSITQNKQRLVRRVLDKIKTFPMFAKPSAMMGGIGTAKLNAVEDLSKWLDARLEEPNRSGYVIQEYVHGREFLVLTVLLQNGLCVPLVVKYLTNISNYESYHSGKPMISIVENFDEANTKNFPNVDKFVKNVYRAFRPPAPQLFMIQGFQEQEGTDSYKLNEFSYRPAGPPVDVGLFSACGINQYTASVMAQVDPEYYPTPERDWKPSIVSTIWYHHTTGVLRQQNAVPTQPEIRGILKAEWQVSPGTRLEQASDYTHVTVMLLLESETKEQRDEDLKRICENWKPDMGAAET